MSKPCVNDHPTIVHGCRLCYLFANDAAYRDSWKENADHLGASEGSLQLCLYLREPVSAFRRRCHKGHANPDGLGGVKPCCDCGPGKCGDYAAAPDGI